MGAGMGAFKGRAGDNKPHRHWAHQVSIGIGIGIGGTARLAAGSQVHEASALFVQAGTAHQLLIGPALSCYLDPTSEVGVALLRRLAARDPMQALTASHIVDIAWAPDSRFAHKAQIAAGKFVKVCGKLAVAQDYCWMQTNKGSAPVTLTVELAR